MVTRRPVVAGMFYPADREILASDIQSYLDQVPPRESGNPLGVVVPHAGYIYSGSTAAYAYRCLEGESYDKVVILAPSHFDAFDGLSVYSGEAMETPLGVVNVSLAERDHLAGIEGVTLSDVGHRQEHSLEVQLPFLQHVLGTGWEVVPLVMGNQSREAVDLAVEILEDYLDPSTLLVISSDLSHYHPYDDAREIDLRFCSFVKDGDLDGLWNAHDRRRVEACGFGPVFAFLTMVAGKENISVEVLDYRNSGDTAGTKDQVVGYCAIGAFWHN